MQVQFSQQELELLQKVAEQQGLSLESYVEKVTKQHLQKVAHKNHNGRGRARYLPTIKQMH